METLQLKDVAGYLPYGLESFQQYHTGTQYIPLHREVNGNNIMSFIDGSTGYDILLLPLSCLIEEIEHKGKKIVPIVELAKLAGNEFDTYNLLSSYEPHRYTIVGLEFNFSFSNKLGFTNQNKGYSLPFNQCAMWDYMNELHIDYRSLIGRGLAKDKRLFNNK